MSLNNEMMNYGYMMSRDLYDACKFLSIKEISRLYNDLIPVLQYIKGDHVIHKLLYPNFPEDMMKLTDYEIYINQFLHYWTCGEFIPNVEKIKRNIKFEHVKYEIIDICNQNDIDNIFINILSSINSINEFDKTIVEYYFKNYNIDDIYTLLPNIIPFTTTRCIVNSYLLKNNKNFSSYIVNATDILRLVTYLSNGDLELEINTKFISLSRYQRKLICEILEKVITESDIKRYKNKWNKLFHMLHVGDYSNKLYQIAFKQRNNKKMISPKGEINSLLQSNDIEKALVLYKKNHSLFLRDLDYLLRTYITYNNIILDNFNDIVNNINNRLLIQLYNHFLNRNDYVNKNRLIKFYKNNKFNNIFYNNYNDYLDQNIIDKIFNIIKNQLKLRFKKLSPLSKCYLNKELKNYPIPLDMKNINENKNTVARGSCFNLDNTKDIIRFFVHWIGDDIDLTISCLDENFELVKFISFTDLKWIDLDANENEIFIGCHSGDIVNAPSPYGASEFVDINIKNLKLYYKEIKYILMNVFVYVGDTFNKLEECFAGWLFLNEQTSNNVFEPKLVDNKFDIINNSFVSIPVVVNLYENKIIWFDYNLKLKDDYAHTIENNSNGIKHILQYLLNYKYFTLYDLFKLHIEARNGILINDINEADIIFDTEQKINPKMINVINSKFL